jgi:hypothetical protein
MMSWEDTQTDMSSSLRMNPRRHRRTAHSTDPVVVNSFKSHFAAGAVGAFPSASSPSQLATDRDIALGCIAAC